jgi:crossover junction endodeoxyribonuclease RuvC
MIILGVDTALRCSGYGILEVTGKKYKALDCGIIKNHRKVPHSECFRCLAGGINELIEKYHPDIASIEGSFYLKNAKTAMILGMARGAVVAALATADIPCYEYAPARAKQAITGHGRAGKEQVASILSTMLGLDVADIPDDATDALAMAVCHALTAQNQGGIYLQDPI